MESHLLLLSPDGMAATWIHPLDLSTGMYPRYDDWIDVTDLSDDEFDALVMRLQRASATLH